MGETREFIGKTITGKSIYRVTSSYSTGGGENGGAGGDGGTFYTRTRIIKVSESAPQSSDQPNNERRGLT